MKTITFYSYKGGVGRTLALANFARYLVEEGKKVVIIDMDLEAPGMLYKLPPDEKTIPPPQSGGARYAGLVDYVDCWNHLKTTAIDIRSYLYQPKSSHSADAGALYVMPAGDAGQDTYWGKLANLDWHSLFGKGLSRTFKLFQALKHQISDVISPDYLLIDARTGITPVGGVATTLMMPDTVLLFFNINSENFDGTIKVADNLSRNRITRAQKVELVPVAVRLPAIDAEFDQNVKEEYDKKINRALNGRLADVNLFQTHILHTDREVEIVESLLIGNAQANESSTLFRDYCLLFARLVGTPTIPDYSLPGATEISYSERMERVESILETIIKQSATQIPRQLLRKIKLGAITSRPESDPDNQEPRKIWEIGPQGGEKRVIKDWEASLPDRNGPYGRFERFWVMLPSFLAYDDPDFRAITGGNLKAGAKYIYFLTNPEDVIRLKTVASELVNYVGRETVEKNLRFIFVTNRLFRAYLRHLNYWIVNPGGTIQYKDPENPPGFEIITKKGRPQGAVPLTKDECQEIVDLVTYSIVADGNIEGMPTLSEKP